MHYKIGPLFQGNSSLTADHKRISEILNEQFKSVFTTPMGHMQINKPDEFFSTTALHREMVTIDYIDIKEEDVISAIDEMSLNSATGPDGLPAILLKSCKQALAKPLQILFQSFLAGGKLPKKLKEGIICPIHK